ncbi:hypothetical protein Tco_1019855 [Tanacetum coccineum]|uniref:Retroviral polymerase SH3-like domain-containing protein n=1 Tax=Tanacetum coccineum TaxID=301880 RepID=A0ABQ5FYD2_9ASTR
MQALYVLKTLLLRNNENYVPMVICLLRYRKSGISVKMQFRIRYGQIGVQNIGNGNVVAARAEGNAMGIMTKEKGCCLSSDSAVDCSKERSRNPTPAKQASTSGTQTDKAPIYDSDGSAEEQYIELLEPIPEPHQVQQNDSNVISDFRVVNGGGGTVDQHPETVEETQAAKFVRDFKSLAKEADDIMLSTRHWNGKFETSLRAVVRKRIFVRIIIDKIRTDKAYNDMQQKIERLQAQLGDLKGKSKDTPCVSKNLDPLSRIENENVELEFQEPKASLNSSGSVSGTVRFGNVHVAAIGFLGDLQWGNILIHQGKQFNKHLHHQSHEMASASYLPQGLEQFYQSMGSLFITKIDREDIGKLGAKGDIGFFIGYSANSCAYRVYNRRTKKIMETMNVTFDELSAMAFEKSSSKPGFKACLWNNQFRTRSYLCSNVKEAMTDPTWIESMQEELLQFKRLDAMMKRTRHPKQGLSGCERVPARGRIDFLKTFACCLDGSYPDILAYAAHNHSLCCVSNGRKNCILAWYAKRRRNHFFKGIIDPTLFIRRLDDDILVVQVYVDDIIFGSAHPRLPTGRPLHQSSSNRSIQLSGSSPCQNRRDLPRNTPLDRVEVLGMIKKRSKVRMGIMPTKTELALEQSQQESTSNSTTNTMAEQNDPAQPPTRTDEQIVPRSQWLTIGKSNLLFNAQKIQKNPIFQISVDILSNTNFFQAFTASANVPAIYLQQFWKTMSYNEKTGIYSCQLDEQWFDLSADLLRKALAITPVNPAHPFELPPSGDTVIDFVEILRNST